MTPLVASIRFLSWEEPAIPELRKQSKLDELHGPSL